MKSLHFIVKIIVVSIVTLALAACGSALKSYQKGNYYAACEEAVNKLRSKPNDNDARYALANAYPLAQNTAMRDINNLSSMQTIGNYEKIVQLYTRINNITESIYRCPAALELIPNPANYYNNLQAAKLRLVEMYYNEGVNALNIGTVEKARYALDLLTRANNHISGYKDIPSLMDEALYLATLRVIVLNPQLPLRYQLNADFFYTRLMSDITRNTYRHLVRFYTPPEAEAQQMRDPHQLLVLNFEDFTVGNTNQTNNKVELKRENVVVGTVEEKGVKKEVLGTVKATLTTSRIEVKSSGVLSIRLVDPATGRILNQKNLRNSATWVSEWASYNGDERALSTEQKRLVQQRQRPLPSEQELFSSFAGPLYEEAMKFISSVY
jgi:hypothetical protein